MTTTDKIWCLLINQEKKLVGSPFQIDFSPDTNIADLRKNVKEEEKANCLEKVDDHELDVWRCTDPILSVNKNKKQLQELVRGVDFSDEKKTAELASATKVMSLKFPDHESSVQFGDDEILLVQFPGAFPLLLDKSEI